MSDEDPKSRTGTRVRWSRVRSDSFEGPTLDQLDPQQLEADGNAATRTGRFNAGEPQRSDTASPAVTSAPDQLAEMRAPGEWAEPSRFSLGTEIAAGGMGAVCEARDELLLRRVAVKLIHPEFAGDRDSMLRFLEEVQITGQLDHPNIVPVYDIGFHDKGQAFLVMKLIKGDTLHDIIHRNAGRSFDHHLIEEYVQILMRVCDALEFAHNRGVVHRDLKPANIMVGRYGEVYVMDWGIALLQGDAHGRQSRDDLLSLTRSLESHRSSGAVLVGTPAYMAPEQAYAKIDEIDERTDVFGLGAILYEMMTCSPPHQAEEIIEQLEQAREGEIPHPLSMARRNLPPGLCRIAMKAMARQRDNRYPDVAALRQALADFSRGGGWFDTREYAPGDVIMREGDAADAAYIIDRGQCQVYRIAAGKKRVLRQLGPGDAFGETAILTGKPRSATVIATTGVKLIVITRENLDYELAEKPWLASFFRALATRFREADRKLAEVAIKRD